MGTQRTDYLVWGVQLDQSNFVYEDFENEIDGSPDAEFDMIYDGMSGQYLIAGKILAASEPYEGLEFYDVDDALLNLDKDVISSKVMSKVHSGMIKSDFKTFLFTHWH
jgi:hypothetical protein